MDGRPIRASKCAANGAKNTGSSSSASTRPNSAGNTNSSDGKIASHNVGWSLTVLSTMASIPSIPTGRSHPPGSAPSDPGSTRRLFQVEVVSCSPLRYHNVGDQHAHSSGGEPSHGFEERARLRRGDGGARGDIVGVVQVDHAVCGRRTAVFLWPYLRCLEPYMSGDPPGSLELFGTECGFEGLGIGRVVVDDGDFCFGH